MPKNLAERYALPAQRRPHYLAFWPRAAGISRPQPGRWHVLPLLMVSFLLSGTAFHFACSPVRVGTAGNQALLVRTGLPTSPGHA